MADFVIINARTKYVDEDSAASHLIGGDYGRENGI